MDFCRRNEVGKVIPSPTAKQLAGESGRPMGIFVEDERQQRAGLFLRDVRYRIHGYFDFIPPEKRKGNIAASPEFWADQQEAAEIVRMDETEAKYAAMFERRAKKGQCFHRPILAAGNLPAILGWLIREKILCNRLMKPVI